MDVQLLKDNRSFQIKDLCTIYRTGEYSVHIAWPMFGQENGDYSNISVAFGLGEKKPVSSQCTVVGGGEKVHSLWSNTKDKD